MESVKNLTLCIDAETSTIIKDIVRKLNNVNVYIVLLYEEDDEILPLIASKTNEKNPLKELQIDLREISKDNFEHFLRNCTFANSASIRLYYSQEYIEDLLAGVGKFEFSVDEFGERCYKIKTGVKIIKGPGDDNVEIKIYRFYLMF
uniref:Uncharacterized protein n=1 Tax=Panagrolaimus sp. JU765 TaxID=591449 RepID=A0AC34QPT7_9BILA